MTRYRTGVVFVCPRRAAFVSFRNVCTLLHVDLNNGNQDDLNIEDETITAGNTLKVRFKSRPFDSILQNHVMHGAVIGRPGLANHAEMGN